MPHPAHDDDGHVDDKPGGHVRQCAATRDRLPQADMIRFARGPAGEVTPDLAVRLPGRGVWVRADRASVEQAGLKGTFARGFRTQCTVPERLADRIEALLVRRLQDSLSLAKKAGALVTGFDQVRAALRIRPPGALIEASDGAEDGRNKVYFLARALYEQVPVCGALTSGELGMALGRGDVVHAFLETGAFSRKWQADYSRLTGFRPAPERNWFSGTRRDF